MSFLSSLFSRNKDNSEQVQGYEEEAPEEAAAEVPFLPKGTIVDISLDNGQFLLTGRVTSYEGQNLTVERKTGQLAFAICPVNSLIKIRGIGTNMMPFELRGRVEESTRVICKIRDAVPIVHEEHRGGFRLYLDTEVSLYAADDERLENPEKCRLVNISIGGACVESEFLHGEDEVLRLKVQIAEYAPMNFLGQVVRVNEATSGRFRYGILFAQMDEQETAALTKTLFNIQTGNHETRSRNRDGPGHW